MLGRIKCWLYGHKRGKLLKADQKHRTYACPRCGRQKSYKVVARADA